MYTRNFGRLLQTLYDEYEGRSPQIETPRNPAETEIVRRNVRAIRIQVLPPDGRVRVSAPYFTSMRTVNAFLEEKSGWIEAQRQRLRAQTGSPRMPFLNGDTLLLFGRPYTVRVECGKARALLLFDDGTALLTQRAGDTPEQREAFVREDCRKRLFAEIETRLPAWERKTGLSCAAWRIRDMKTRWGSCAVASGRLTFNLHLIKKPHCCIDYVLVHELCHLRHPDHGKAFHALLAQYIPEEKTLRRQLNA